MSNQMMSVVVSLGDTAIFVVDEAGRVLAPPGAEDRAGIAAVLAQAAARLAMMPPEPVAPPIEATIQALGEHLGSIGTPEAIALNHEFATRLSEMASLMRTANSIIAQNAIAAGERALGATEH